MPFINTKLSEKITKEQREELTKKLEENIQLLGKPKDWLMIGFEDEQSLYFRDSSEKVAFVEVKLYGKAAPQAYDKLTGVICESYEKVLGIPQSRIFVKYEEVSNWGWNGSNF